MVFFEKTQPAPASLSKKSCYREADVVCQLRKDFKNKCYICEQGGITSINVEHFVPHNGDKNLMYEWDNLFYACVHCNGTKADLEKKYKNPQILNCTKREDLVDECISYRVETFLIPTKILLQNQNILGASDRERVENTIQLLNATYNGSGTSVRNIESENLQNSLLKEMDRFYKLIFNYKKKGEDLSLKQQIAQELENDSSFTAFKRWIVRDDPDLADFLR